MTIDTTYDPTTINTLIQNEEEEQLEPQEEAMRAHEKGSRVALRTIVTVLAIIIGILLVLFIVSKAALYNSIFDMLRDMSVALGEVIRRIFS